MIPTLVDYKNDKLGRRDKILLSVVITIVLGMAAMALIPAASATITITPTTVTSTSITWSWSSVAIQNLSIDGMYVYSINPSATSFYLSGLDPKETHTIRIVTAVDSGTATTETLEGSTIINGYASFSGEGSAITPSDDVSTYSNTTDSGYGMTLTLLTLRSEADGTVTNFKFSLGNGSQITGTISDTSTGWFSGEHTISIDGGNSVTTQYTKTPIGNFIPTTAFFWFTDNSSVGSSNRPWYFVASTRGYNANSGQTDIPGVGVDIFNTYTLDPATDSYVSVSDMVSNPITKLSFTNSANSPDMKPGYWESTLTHLQTAPIGPNDRTTNLLDLIYSSILAVIAFIASLSQLAAWILTGGLFLVTGETFLIINACYEAIVLVLCIDDATEIDKVVTKWIRYQVKLWKFYMMLYKDMKEIIKWW